MIQYKGKSEKTEQKKPTETIQNRIKRTQVGTNKIRNLDSSTAC